MLRRLLTTLAFVLLCAVGAHAQTDYTTTPNLGLKKPKTGSTNWSIYVNSDFDTLDAAIGVFKGGFVNVPFSTTPVFNMTLGNTFQITLQGNVVSSTVNQPLITPGQLMYLITCQNATGGFAFTFPASFQLPYPTIATGPSQCTDTTWQWNGAKWISAGGGSGGGGGGGAVPQLPFGSLQFYNTGATLGGSKFIYNPTDTINGLSGAGLAAQSITNTPGINGVPAFLFTNDDGQNQFIVSVDTGSIPGTSGASSPNGFGAEVSVTSSVWATSTSVFQNGTANPMAISAYAGGTVSLAGSGGGDCFGTPVVTAGTPCAFGTSIVAGDFPNDTNNNQELIGATVRFNATKANGLFLGHSAGFLFGVPFNCPILVTSCGSPVFETFTKMYGLEVQNMGGFTTVDEAGVLINAQTAPSGGTHYAIEALPGSGLNLLNDGVQASFHSTTTANGALTGVVRLASADTITWRNNANSGDLALSKNASDQLIWPNAFVLGGTVIVGGSSGTVTFPTAITGIMGVIQGGTVNGDCAAIGKIGGVSFLFDSGVSGCGSGGGGVASVSGDGTIITNSSSTGPVTLTIAGTSGGVPCFTSTSAWASSTLLTHFGLVYGGGAGTCPSATAASTTVTNVPFATATSPAFRNIGTSDTTLFWYAADSGAANAYVIAPSPAVTALSTGTQVSFTTTHANTAASTINVSGLGVKSITKFGAVALAANDIVATKLYYLTYDGTEWQLDDPSTVQGTVTSVGASFTGGLISVAGTPVTTSGTLAFTIAGTSGGIPCFNSAASWISSPALGANGVLYGGGAGNCPLVAAASTTVTNAFFATATAPGFRNIGTSDTSVFWYAAAAGAANVLTVTLAPAATALTTGTVVTFLPNNANTSATPTLNVNGLGAKTITKLGTNTLVANDLITTAIAVVIYDGTGWELQNPQTASGGGGGPTIQTNGIGNTVQTTLNFLTSSANVIGGTITPSNPTGGQEVFELSGRIAPIGGGTGVSSPAAHSLLVTEGASNMNLVTSPAVNGFYACGFNVIASATVDPTCALQGVPVDATNPATLLYTDRANYLNWTAGTALALPAVTGNFASNLPFVIRNTSTTLTITPNAGASDLIDGSATGTLIPNFAAFVYQDSTSAPGHWFTVKFPTFQSFGATCANVLTWSTATGFTCSNASGAMFANFTPHQFLGNNTGGSTSASPSLIGSSDVGPNLYAVATGIAQAQIVALTPAVTALTAGTQVFFLPVAANTGAAPTLAVNGLAAKSITKLGTSTALIANDMTTNAVAFVVYDGTEWQLQNPQTATGGGGTPCTVTANALQYNNAGAFGCTTPFTFAANAITAAAAGLLDLSGATGASAFKVPVQAGATAASDGVIDYDSTAKLTHHRTNGADSIAMSTTATSTTTTQAAFASAVAGVYTLRAIAVGDLPTITAAIGGTGLNTSASTGVAQVAAGTWSISAALANATTATTQASTDNTTDVATDAFVNTAVSNGIAGSNPAVAVLVATVGSNLVGTYANGTAGVGATFTITATGTFTLDGVTINTIGQRVLLKDQSSAFQNGVYTATTIGTGGVSAVFTRALDYNTPSNINTTGTIPVQSGTVNATTSWLLTSTVVTMGTDALTYVQFSLAPTNIVTAAAAAAAAKQLCTSGGATKTCAYVDFPEVLIIPAANCNNTTAGVGWSIGASGVATCRAGTNNLGGYISITDTSSSFATFQVAIPEDWDTGTNPYIRFQLASTDATNAHTIIPEINVACYKGDGSTTDDVAPNGFHSLSTTTLNGNANRFWSTSNVQMNSTDVTGCVAGALMQITVGRATDTATNAQFYSATVTFPRLITVQAN